ncbi:MOFRL family protein, partial [Roseisolibacter sp. H3M3-2]|uniref:MOFRL family protein n=1 Tax=Roseisolibacter sp. H3M3-2 TaxID=3031323 RepID=UPI0023D99FB2
QNDMATIRLLWGGETTGARRGGGRGGRNQELALAAAAQLALMRAPGVVASAGTDGVDGPTAAAGGIVDAPAGDALRARGGDPALVLADNDAYAALDAAGALLRPGPTHTNVMDVQVALCGAAGAADATGRP